MSFAAFPWETTLVFPDQMREVSLVLGPHFGGCDGSENAPVPALLTVNRKRSCCCMPKVANVVADLPGPAPEMQRRQWRQPGVGIQAVQGRKAKTLARSSHLCDDAWMETNAPQLVFASHSFVTRTQPNKPNHL